MCHSDDSKLLRVWQIYCKSNTPLYSVFTPPMTFHGYEANRATHIISLGYVPCPHKASQLMHCDLPCLPNVGHCICLRPPAVDEREAPARRQSSLQGIVYVSSGSSVYQLGPAVDMDFHGLEVSHLPCWLARHSDSAPLGL